MEKWKIVGYRRIDFTGRDGKAVDGYNLYLAREPISERIVGLEVMKLFICRQYIDYEPKVNEIVSICYNRFGHVESIVRQID